MRVRPVLIVLLLLVAGRARASDDAVAPAEARFASRPVAEVGRLQLAPRGERVGVRFGHQHLDGRDWLVTTPVVDLRRGKLELELAPALRFELCRGDVAWAGCVDVEHRALKPYDRRGTFRTGDWHGPAAPLRILGTLRWAEPGDPFHLAASRTGATTLGEGGLVRRYQANADPDVPRLPVHAGVAREAAAADVLVNDVAEPSLWAARVAVRPMWGEEDELARTTTISLTAAADARAPLRPRSGADAAGLARPDSAYERGTVSAISVAVDAIARRTEAWTLRPYAEGAQLVGAGGGVALGLAAERALGRGRARLSAEGRSFDPNYLPGYFDTFYETQKFQYDAHVLGAGPLPLTKWEEISARTGPRRWGLALDAALSLRRVATVAAGFEVSTAPRTRSAYVHAELPVCRWLQLFGTLHRRNFERQPWFTSAALDLPTTAFVSGARLKVLPFLFVNGAASQAAAFDPAAGRYVVRRSYEADVEIGVEM